MRPINRGNSPQVYTDYKNAKPDLVDRLGTYCSFCERRIPTNLAVEHIFPKDDNLPYAHLRNEWNNFLLSCVNCNSAKGTQIISTSNYLLPDRDNTFPYFDYQENGMVEVFEGNYDDDIVEMAQKVISLVNLNLNNHPNWNDSIMFSAIERIGQRVQAWVQAKDAYSINNPLDPETIRRRYPVQLCNFQE